MSSKIRVAILDDHQSIIDGFSWRLAKDPNIEIVATATYGEDLEPMMANNPVDVLLLDVSVPNSALDDNLFPVLYVIPRILHNFPSLNILIISMYSQPSLVEALTKAGISGYIYKDDQASIQKLDQIVRKIANNGRYFSEGAVPDSNLPTDVSILTPRQLEALSLCAALPDAETLGLAKKLGIKGSTMRNLLSGAYVRLGVRTRAAAIVRAQQLGILPKIPELSLAGVNKRTVSPEKSRRKDSKVGESQ